MNPWSTVKCLTKQALPPLHPNISLHILQTVLYTFPLMTRRICLPNEPRTSLASDHFLHF